MKFVIYCKSTGDVIAHIEAPSEKHALAQEDETQGVLAVDNFPEGDYQCIDGTIVEGSSEAKLNKQLERTKSEAILQVESLVEKAVSKVSRQGQYFNEAYAEKVELAKAYLQGAKPDTYDFSMLEDISKVRGISEKKLAEEWLSKSTDKTKTLRKTETIREKVNLLIKQSKSKSEVATILEDAKKDLVGDKNAG